MFSRGRTERKLHKDVNSISSVRSRLYVKVFNQKGGAKDWDEFLRTL